MHRMVDKLIQQYGTQMMLCRNGEETAVRGFFRAVTSTDRQSMEGTVTALGELSLGKYTYIGPAGLPVSPGDTVTVGEKVYRFRRVEPCHYGSRVLYYWGLCVEKGGELP